MRTGLLFFTVIVSAIIGLVLGSEEVRWLMAIGLAVVAVPLFKAIRQAGWFSNSAKSKHTLDLILAELESDDHQATPKPDQEPPDRPGRRRANVQ